MKMDERRIPSTALELKLETERLKSDDLASHGRHHKVRKELKIEEIKLQVPE
jgi:hypothetical protein